MRIVAIAAFGLFLAGPAVAEGGSPPSRLPSEMAPSEIKAHNAGLETTDPYYIKCRKTEVLGSLAKKERVCRTNEQWKKATARGNDSTREMVEGFARSGGTNGN